ncbi:hypothetical protein niasHS_009353 [Heterodera schachtii]|uniref:SprT-like domain-containing protein n=1 Tax=Heterodera schachtii TaxID=97005 RepID=A0ABD2JBW1_HETSC
MPRETNFLSAEHRRLIARHEASHVAANWLHKYGCRYQYVEHRILIARHEAGHIAANWLHKYGCRCQYITIIPDATTYGHTSIDGMDFYNANQMDALHQYKCGRKDCRNRVLRGSSLRRVGHGTRRHPRSYIADRFERRKEKSVPNAATQGSGEGLRRTEKIMNRISELHEAKFNYLTKMFSKPEIRQKIEALANALLEKDTLQCAEVDRLLGKRASSLWG